MNVIWGFILSLPSSKLLRSNDVKYNGRVGPKHSEPISKDFKKICSRLQLYTFTTSYYFKPSFQCYAELESFSASLELVLPAKYARSDPFLLTTLFGIVWVGCGLLPHLNLKIAKRIVRIQLFDVHNTSNIFISKSTTPWFKKRAVDVIRTVLYCFLPFSIFKFLLLLLLVFFPLLPTFTWSLTVDDTLITVYFTSPYIVFTYFLPITC